MLNVMIWRRLPYLWWNNSKERDNLDLYDSCLWKGWTDRKGVGIISPDAREWGEAKQNYVDHFNHACIEAKALKGGKEVHRALRDSGELSRSCRMLSSACLHGVGLWKMLSKSSTHWSQRTGRGNLNTMISAYNQSGFTEEASNLFQQMQEQGLRPTWSLGPQ